MKICTFDTELTADCFEAVPNHENLVTVGTYQFFPQEDTRKGRIYLMEAGLDGFKELQRLDLAGILDMKWASSEELACALSNGSIQRFKMINNRLEAHSSYDIDSDAIALSLDVCQGKTVVSLSNGKVGLLDLEENLTIWKAHLCEVWCAGLDKHDQSGSIVYTGSDDYSWCIWDTREQPTRPSSKSTFHQAGVCFVASDPHRPGILATGSYDETLAMWDTRNIKSPLSTFQAKSGVWRLRWHPRKTGILLAACMHDGFKLLDITDFSSITEVAALPTQSIAYGCDFVGDSLFGGSTFYNHEAILWSQ